MDDGGKETLLACGLLRLNFGFSLYFEELIVSICIYGSTARIRERGGGGGRQGVNGRDVLASASIWSAINFSLNAFCLELKESWFSG